MKYVVVKNYPDFGEPAEVPIMFPDVVKHSTIRKASNDAIAVSAGFCVRENGQWRVYGESLTLRLQSRPVEDALLLNAAFGDV